MGYFLQDLYKMFGNWNEYPEDVLHHLLGTCSLLSSLTSKSGIFLIVPEMKLKAIPLSVPWVYLAETSTVFLNALWFLREFGYGY